MAVIFPTDGKGKICTLIRRDILDYHVHFNAGLTDRPQYRGSNPRDILHTQHGQFRLIPRKRDTRNDRLFHGFILSGYQRTRRVIKTGQHSQRHLIFTGKFNCSRVQDLRTEAREFKHFFKGDFLQAASALDHPGVSREYPFHISVYLAFIGIENRRQRNRGRVGTTTPQCRDIAVIILALEPGNNRHHAFIDPGPEIRRINVENPGPGMAIISQNAGLAACVGACLNTVFHQHHGKQRYRDLLTCRQQHVYFTTPGYMLVINLISQGDQAIGFGAHGGYDHDDVMAGLP